MTEKADSSTPRTSGADTQPGGVFGRIWGRLAGIFRTRSSDADLRIAIEELIEEHREDAHGEDGAINADEHLLIGNVLKLRDVTVADVMVPRAEIVAIDASASREEIVDLISREAHSRIPIYRETLDDVVGMIHIKDVLARYALDAPFDLKDIIRKILFVSPTMRILDLLLEMRLARVHMGLVVDEFGGVDGLVTIEDVVEEIVGDIQDEHDVEDIDMIDRPDGSIIADARTEIDDFEDRVGVVLTDDERESIDTLGGLVAHVAGHVPSRGEVIRHSSGIEFEVIDADPRRVKRLRLRRLPASGEVKTPQ